MGRPDRLSLDNRGVPPGAAHRNTAYAAAIHALGEPRFPDRFLATIAETVDVDLCSAFLLTPSGDMHFLFAAGWTPGSSDFARSASTGYARTFWRTDPAMSKLPDCETVPTIFCQRWDKIPFGRYRKFCYEEPGVVERVSIQVCTEAGLTQVGLYRMQGHGFFSASDLRQVERVSDVLTALAAKHGALTTLRPTVPLFPDRNAVARRLACMYASLSAREVEVCAALLCGNSAKQAALHLGIEASSVVTYRKRAFLKLGVATLRELLRRYDEACPPS